MSQFDQLFDEAAAAFGVGELVGAALCFQRAADYARSIQSEEARYKAIVWAAEALQGAGRYFQAQSLLLDAFSCEPVGIFFEKWMSRTSRFRIVSRWRPHKAELEEIVADLEQGDLAGLCPSKDLFKMRGDIFLLEGNWSAALNCAERAYLLLEESGEGLIPAEMAILAFEASLALKNHAAANDWLRAICVNSGWTGSDTHFELQVRAFQAQCKLALARSRGEPYLNLRRLLRDFSDKAQNIDVREIEMNLRIAESRISLLDPDGGDPGGPLHSARITPRNQLKNPLDVHDRYYRALLVLDIRIAALRFTFGLPPVDDEYFDSRPLSGRQGNRVHASDVTSRRRKAKGAWRIARRHATNIDIMLGCNWRQMDVKRRESFIECI
jgi:tetratricopeptide (TPR) repeat protein